MSIDKTNNSALRAKWRSTDDPSQDGWATEVFNSQADQQLKKIGKMILHPEKLGEHLVELIDKEFRSSYQYPLPIETVYEDKELTVRRFSPSASGSGEEKDIKQGKTAFTELIKGIGAPFQGAKDLRFKFKLYRVNKEKDHITTYQYFALSGLTDQGMLEQNATWRIIWKERDNGLPVLANLFVEAFEEVQGHASTGRLLHDYTEAVLGDNPSYSNQILHGYQEFLGKIENTHEFNIFGAAGLAVGDVNNDGLDDLYLCQEQGLPNRLYLQQENGTAVDISAKAGVDWLESSRSPLFIDFDNDGDQDLAVTMPGALVLAENNGQGVFTINTVLALDDDPMSMAAADYDLDGDVDVYVTLYNPNSFLEKNKNDNRAANTTFVYHDADNGPENVLLRNDITSGKKWLFTDVTEETGLNINNTRFSLAASWEDYDNDGDQDLYVANDYGRDNLYRNEMIHKVNGKNVYRKGDNRFLFTDISAESSVEDSAGSMAVTWGDYDRDGNMDAFISAMWSSAGNRVTFQEGFKYESPEVKARLQKFAKGNTLLRNHGDGKFHDKSEDAGVTMGRWAWASSFADLNNDGWEDLLVANGFLTGDPKGGDL
ncbi:MAG: VCBS repeat-containing protein [Candidatus Electrothrix sp. GW3-4]|uniref:FG-GAP repeat domain-containing protein n=1 Tax=Candidatus Electrothrix sp. GW3-4 TaxID=3126740 RepID=UPI0030CB7450